MLLLISEIICREMLSKSLTTVDICSVVVGMHMRLI
jgi:hypothetical protein